MQLFGLMFKALDSRSEGCEFETNQWQNSTLGVLDYSALPQYNEEVIIHRILMDGM